MDGRTAAAEPIHRAMRIVLVEAIRAAALAGHRAEAARAEEPLKHFRPALAERFVFSTGDIIARETREFLEQTGKPWVEKPFDMQKLVIDKNIFKHRVVA